MTLPPPAYRIAKFTNVYRWKESLMETFKIVTVVTQNRQKQTFSKMQQGNFKTKQSAYFFFTYLMIQLCYLIFQFSYILTRIRNI